MHIRHVHPRYQAMAQSSLQRETSQESLLEHVRSIQRAVVAYATQVCATVDNDDDVTIEVARDALAAIDKMRVTASSQRVSGTEPDPIPAPVAEPVVEDPAAKDAPVVKSSENK